MAALIIWALFYGATAIVSLLFVAYLYYLYVFTYFKKRGIPYEPAAFPFGNLTPVFTLKRSYNELLADLYFKYKGQKLVGFFQLTQKSILLTDRDLMKSVIMKDYEYFNEKNIHYNRNLQPLSANLFAIGGTEWKDLRTKMSPVFTSGKLKDMFKIIVDVGHALTHFTSSNVQKNKVVECKDIFTRYGLAIIASTAFGLESDVLTDKSSMFFRMSENLTSPTFSSMFRNSVLFFGRDIAKVFNLKTIPDDSHKFFQSIVEDVVEHREKHGSSRNDFIQLLMQLKHGVKNNGKEYSITLNEIAAQSYLFIIAGFETTSNTMSFFLYEMALNPEVQRRVHEEVDAVEEITYENLAEMEYLDMAIDETLRKYSPLGFIGRVCSQDYKVPDTDTVIEKGTQVLVSLHGLHWDPELFPEPERFIPERFSKENRNNIKSFSYVPFGEGPRFCLGMRMGKLSVKAGLAIFMKKFEVHKVPETPVPMQFEVKTMSTTSKSGMNLRLVER